MGRPERRHQELTTRVMAWRQRAENVERRIYRRGCGYGAAWDGRRCVNRIADPR